MEISFEGLEDFRVVEPRECVLADLLLDVADDLVIDIALKPLLDIENLMLKRLPRVEVKLELVVIVLSDLDRPESIPFFQK